MELILIKNLLNSGERNNPKLQNHSPRENPTCMYFVLHYRVESTLQRVKMDEGPIYQAEGYHWNHPFNSIARLLTGHKTCYYMSYYLVEREWRERENWTTILGGVHPPTSLYYFLLLKSSILQEGYIHSILMIIKKFSKLLVILH